LAKKHGVSFANDVSRRDTEPRRANNVSRPYPTANVETDPAAHLLGATIIAEALRKNRTLATLSLGANRIRAAGAAAFSDTLILRGRDGTLRNLDLCSNQIGDEGASYLSEALSRDASLTQLDLARNAIADEGVSS
jgi:hypothetical protein